MGMPTVAVHSPVPAHELRPLCLKEISAFLAVLKMQVEPTLDPARQTSVKRVFNKGSGFLAIHL